MIRRSHCVVCMGDVRQLLIAGHLVWRHLVRPADGHDAKVAPR